MPYREPRLDIALTFWDEIRLTYFGSSDINSYAYLPLLIGWSLNQAVAMRRQLWVRHYNVIHLRNKVC